jgi:hypothetical protein
VICKKRIPEGIFFSEVIRFVLFCPDGGIGRHVPMYIGMAIAAIDIMKK